MAVPKLRFKEFDGEWFNIKLKKMVKSLDAGVSVNAENTPPENDEFSVLKTSCVSLGCFDTNERKTVKETIEIDRLKEPLLDCSLVMNRSNTPALVGASAFIRIAPKNTFLSDKLWQFKVFDNTNIEWLAFYLSSEKTLVQLRDLATGTSNSMKNITKPDVLNIDLFAPQKEEQTKIASFLSAVDEKISQFSQKHELLSQYKQGMMQKLFSQQIRFKADDGSEFGEWVEWKFASCIDIFDNLRKPVSASERKVGFTPYYGANGIQSYIDGYTHEGEFILIAEDGANDLINYPVQYVNGKIWVNNHAHVVSGKHHIVDNKFLKYRLGSIDFTKYLVGGGRAKLNAGAMKEIAFLLPCLEEQTKIANFLSAIDQKIEVVARQIEQAKTWKKGLLQQMFV